MQLLEVSGAVRPLYGSLGVKELLAEAVTRAVPASDDGCQHPEHVELPTEI